MAFTEATFKQDLFTTGVTTAFTVLGGTTSILMYIHIVNNDTSDRTVEVWADSDGTSAGNTELIVPGMTVPANDVLSMRVWIPLATGSTIKIRGSVGSVLSITLAGNNIT